MKHLIYKNYRRYTLCLLVLVFTSLLILGTSSALDLPPEKEKIAEQIFTDFFSPFCPGRVLQDCPSSKATELRDAIRLKLSDGQSQEDIENYLISVYGESLLASPRNVGFGRVAWLGPLIFLLGGLVALAAWLATRRSKQEPNTEQALATGVAERIEREIQG